MSNRPVTSVFENAAYLLPQESLPYSVWQKQESTEKMLDKFKSLV
jgi:hypothetical protein